MPLALPSTDPQPLGAGEWHTDAFHRQPLFVVEPQASHSGVPRVVRSWNEAHALHGPARPSDVNPAYVAALISGNPSAVAAPYQRIGRLPRAHHIAIATDGTITASPYDPLAGGAPAMAPEALHRFLREGLLEHVKRVLAGHNGPIGCEHSSGLDSNAVLGALVHGEGLPPERLHTWSLEDGGEGPPLERFRPFYRLVPEQCHRLSAADALAARGDDQLREQVRIFGAAAQTGGNPLAVAWMREQGCTVLFSGFGGDQALSHNANNVPTDLVARGRWRELVQWMGGRRMALKTAGSRALALTCRPWAMGRVRRRSRGFFHSDLLERALTPEGCAWLAPHLQTTYPWELDGYLPQHMSIRRRVLADWVAVRAEEETRLAAANGMAKAFPLLDERLIATLLHQDPALFGEGMKRGRLLHRRAFEPFLPPALRDNPTKDRLPEGGLDRWQADLTREHRQLLRRHLDTASHWHPALDRWWDLDAIRREGEGVLERSEASLSAASFEDVLGSSKALATMAALNDWWQALDG
jgi:asparagine synthetase B (glutamine-hydrolysing)